MQSQQPVCQFASTRQANAIGDMAQATPFGLDHAPTKETQTRINSQNTHSARAFVAFVSRVARNANKRQAFKTKAPDLTGCRKRPTTRRL
jgi:hypothetical protein